MATLGYPIKSVQDEFEASAQDRISDPKINHISDNYGFRGVWITKDVSAKRVHLELIRARRVSVIWIHRQYLSTPQQHRIITFGITGVQQDLTEASGPIHYRVTFHGQPNRERITYHKEWSGRRQRDN